MLDRHVIASNDGGHLYQCVLYTSHGSDVLFPPRALSRKIKLLRTVVGVYLLLPMNLRIFSKRITQLVEGEWN